MRGLIDQPMRLLHRSEADDLNPERRVTHSSWAASPTALVTITVLGFTSSYFQQFIFPAVPLVPWGDQVMWLQNGIRILGGRLPYRDYFQLTTPGTDLFYALLLGVWGTRAWIPNLMMAFLGAGAALLITLIARRVLSGAMALLPGVLFIGFVLPGSLYATHHWFSTVSVLGTVLVLIEEVTTTRAAAAGALCGLAGYFTQTKAVLAIGALLVYFILRRERMEGWREVCRRCGAVCGAAAIVLIVADAYFMRAAGLMQFLFWTVVFPIRYFAAAGPYNTWRAYGMGFGLHMGAGHLLGFIFVHATVPLVYVVFFIQYVRKRIEKEKEAAQLLIALVGSALFLAIASAPSPLRVFSVSPPALILLFCMSRENWTARVGLYASTAIAFVLAIAVPMRTQTHWRAFLDTPSGRIAFREPERYEEFRWAFARTHTGEGFFGNPPMCFALGLQNPTPLNFTTTDDFTRPSQVAQLLRTLEENHVPLMMLVPGGYLPRYMNDASDHMEPFREYLEKHYELEERFETGDEAWVRIDSKESGGASAAVNPHGLDEK